jgi:hypothetical protein
MKSITVAELIRLLNTYDENTQVIFASDYGDHCHTQQVHFIDGDLKEVAIGESAYSDSGFRVVDEDEEDEEDTEEEKYLLLS